MNNLVQAPEPSVFPTNNISAEAGHSDGYDELTTLTITAMQQFKDVLATGEGAIHSASAAILLHQHLTAANFQVAFEANDKFAVVQAVSWNLEASETLSDLASELLNDLTAFQGSQGDRGFTVRRISNGYSDTAMTLTVVFASFGAPPGDEGIPCLPAIDISVPCSANDAELDDDDDDIELF